MSDYDIWGFAEIMQKINFMKLTKTGTLFIFFCLNKTKIESKVMMVGG